MKFKQLNEVSDHTSDPVRIALRSHMKGLFLNKFAKQISSDDNDIVVYGSTLMRELDYRDIKVPEEKGIPNLDGIKSSDIDIGLKTEGRINEKAFHTQLCERVTPKVKQAIIDSGLNYRSADSHRNDLPSISTQDVANISADTLMGDFFLEKRYSRDDIEQILSSRDDYEELKPYIQDNMNINLVIEVNKGPYANILPPKKTSAEINGGQSYYIVI